MKTGFGFTVLSLVVLLPLTARGQKKVEPVAATRVALVAGDKTPAARNVAALAEVKLSQTAGVVLLERQAIDKVLAEQKLSLSGVVATDQVVAVGKLLSVDLFAVLEGADAKDSAGLVVFDARTGVRLWDAALPAGDLDETVSAVASGVRAALGKRTDKLRPVCFLTVRNADLPRDLDGFCDSVGLLLERHLVASPDLAVLERRRLEQVNKERDLPADSPLRQLLASVVTVELDVGASMDRKGLKATALLSDSKGKSLGKVTASAASRDAAALSQELSKELAQALNAKAATGEGKSVQEAGRFYREATFFLTHKDFPRSLRAAESAYALEAADPFFQAVLARSLFRYAVSLLNLAGRPVVEPENLLLSLSLARRGSELLARVQSVAPDFKLPRAFLDVKRDAEGTLLNYRPLVNERRKTLTEEERSAFESIQTNHNRSLDVQLDRALKAVRDKQSFDAYSQMLSWAMNCNGRHRFLPPAEWAKLLCGLQDWAEIAHKYEDERAIFSINLLWHAIQSYGEPRQLAAADIARLQKCWSELELHPNPTIAVYGKLGGVVNRVTFGILSPADARGRVRDFRLSVQGKLEKGDELSNDLRCNLYKAATSAFSSDSILKLPGHLEERNQLCEFMLRRKEVYAPLVESIGENVVFFRGTPEQYRTAHDFLKRALELLEGDKGVFLSNETTPMEVRVERDRFRSSALQLQSRIRAANPLAGPKPAAPWEKVTTLIDIQPNFKGILWLQKPLVHEEMIYTAAVRMDGSPAKFAVQLLRLTPGKTEPWEGKPLPLNVRLPEGTGAPSRGPGRHRLNFGTAACIHQGRYFLGTKENGIFVFPFDNSPPERISTAEGLPSDSVQALVCHEGRLYACLGELLKESYVISWDLKDRKCDVLASSRRKESRSPFDDNPPIVPTAMLADPARGRILLMVHSNSNKVTLNGLWSLDVKSSDWKHLLPLQSLDCSLCGPLSRVEGDRLIFNGAVGSLVYDLTKKNTRLLFDGKVSLEVMQPKCVLFQLEALPAYRITLQEFLNVRAPHMLVDGWVWGALPFSRRRFDSSKMEYLSSLRTRARNLSTRANASSYTAVIGRC